MRNSCRRQGARLFAIVHDAVLQLQCLLGELCATSALCHRAQSPSPLPTCRMPQNQPGALPLRPAALGKVAVLGPFANVKEYLLG